MGPCASLAASGYTRQCNQLLREESMSWIALSLSTVTHRVGDQGTFSTDKHCSKCPRPPCKRSCIPLVPWQIGPPLSWILTCYLGILSRWASPPLSALTQQHAGTSHAGWWTGEELPSPTWGTHWGIVQHLSSALLLSPRFPFPWPIPWWFGTSSTFLDIVTPTN